MSAEHDFVLKRTKSSEFILFFAELQLILFKDNESREKCKIKNSFFIFMSEAHLILLFCSFHIIWE